MPLTRNEFAVLLALSQTGEALTQRALSERCDLSLGTVNGAVRTCVEQGLIEGGRLTEAGIQALEPYRVHNAVIMAAGLSSRFAPISYERPKGMLRVRGEVLIERQIRQLREAGIDDITVVVGYKKEYFFYLAAKYGVHIVVNDAYAEKNNTWTLWLVRNRLSNTYICSSDDYFCENPFERYVWRAYYAAQHVAGPTPEWCLGTDARGRITSVSAGGRDAWVMLGHVYFDAAFSQRFVELLGQELEGSDAASQLWEAVFAKHLDELAMEMRRYPAGLINEFDSLDELEGFDPEFIANVDSEVFDNIERALGCKRTDIHGFWPLKQGITNLSCHFAVGDDEYVYRHPGVGTELLIDRNAELAALETACQLGIDRTFIYEDPARGWKISRFIKGARNLDAHNPEELGQAMRMARSLHDQNVRVERSFDFFEEGTGYERDLLAHGPISIPDYHDMAEKARRVSSYARADGAPVCLCHNDFFGLNFLVDANGHLDLIDWEYAGMSDYANDFGTFCTCEELSDEEISDALEAYFGRTPTPEERRHNLAHIGLAGWCWYVWALLKEAEGDNVGEWLYIYYRYGKKYLDVALALYEDTDSASTAFKNRK